MKLTLILYKFSDKLHCQFFGVLVWIGVHETGKYCDLGDVVFRSDQT